MAAAAGASLRPCASDAEAAAELYDVPAFGNVSLLHITDTHAQLLPVYFREPEVNLGVGPSAGKPPHLVGEALLKRFAIPEGSAQAYAFTYLDFEQAARRYGKVGGFAHLATLVKRLRASRPRAILLDGGDSWQGSATSLWTQGADMVGAQKLLGVEHHDRALGVHLRRGSGETGGRERTPLRSSSSRRTSRPPISRTRCFKPYSLRERERRVAGNHRPGFSLHPDRPSALPWCPTGLSASRSGNCRRLPTRRAPRARRSWSCFRTTAWTSISRSPRACAASTRSSAAIPTTACRRRS